MFNLDRVGKKVAIIKENKKYEKKAIYISPDEDEDIDGFSHMHLDSGKFQLTVDTSTRQILYITGASGSGKSTFCVNYIHEWKKHFKKSDIYVFSALSEDETLDQIKDLKRIRIDESLEEQDLDYQDFKNCMVVFDDTDCISNKKTKEEVYKIMNKILEIGRHFNIYCIVTNHLPTNGLLTKRILNECVYLVYFPNAGASRQLKYLLYEYLGLERKLIAKNKKLKSRYCVVHKQYPMFILSEKDIFLVNDEDE